MSASTTTERRTALEATIAADVEQRAADQLQVVVELTARAARLGNLTVRDCAVLSRVVLDLHQRLAERADKLSRAAQKGRLTGGA
jgi:hypothetical protein